MIEDFERVQGELWELRAKLTEQETLSKHNALVAAGWPEVLIKAVDDPFDYAVKLKDGSLIFFEYAVPCGRDKEWALLVLNDMHQGSNAYLQSVNYRIGAGKDRGLEVRVSEIVWAADAPYGS
jgi:hypothetical protein